MKILRKCKKISYINHSRMEQSWIQKPSILFEMKNIKNFVPTTDMTYVEKLNAITRFVWYASAIMYLLNGDVSVFFVPIIGMLCMFFLVKWGVNVDGLKEQFKINKITCQEPTHYNPFMNALVSDARNRKKACEYTSDIKSKINKEFDYNLYKDTDDVYGANNSQRQFYTMPSTTFPNGQSEFANWLYKPEPTCKEGICW